MSQIILIAKEEWRYWLRSKLALISMVFIAILLAVTSVTTAMQMESERDHRVSHQAEAEDTFKSQPDRHPHRMVHYGHYVFRAPAPLSVLDPGVDPVTGQSIFLEGHRQNSAMFAERASGANMGGLAFLTPAFVYQLFVPLLIIILGHGSIVREREASTLGQLQAQGITSNVLISGKGLALLGVAALLLLPLIPGLGIAIGSGESLITCLSFMMTYLLYLTVWVCIVLVISTLTSNRPIALASLFASWALIGFAIPSLSTGVASIVAPIDGKIETDFRVLEAKKTMGDLHNANDPAFEKLKTDTLTEYGVEKIEDLPINWRGVVARYGEKRDAEVTNKFADERMLAETKQSSIINAFGWLSPTLAFSDASRKLAGSDLHTHHRFLREAEALRIDFIQAINETHIEKLSYEDDINRNKDKESFDKTRLDQSNWNVLKDFHFVPDQYPVRFSRASLSILILSIWTIVLSGMLFFIGRSLQP